jgi:hypothetical protein
MAAGPQMSGGTDEGVPGGPPPGHHRSPTALLTLAVVVLVLVVVVVLVVMKLTGTSTTPPPSNGPAPQALPAGTAAEVSGVPLSVFNAVGVSSPTVPVSRASAVSGQPLLTSGGRPEVLYVGAEFCAYCAAERWPLVVALSRFGTLSGLGTMQSSSNGAFPDLQTFTFATATYKSRYIAFASRERYSDQQNSAGTAFSDFQLLDPAEASVFDRYDVPAHTGQPRGTLAFVDVGNRYVSAGSSFSPSILAGLSRNQIANGLTDPKDPVTQAIVASANELSAQICAIDGQRPASVCTSLGLPATTTPPVTGPTASP